MATIKYFSGDVQLDGVYGMDNAEFAKTFPTIKGRRFDSFSRMVGRIKGSNTVYPVERAIEYKSNPSKHICDARCINATGRIMKCECSCGGKNHGKASFKCD